MCKITTSNLLFLMAATSLMINQRLLWCFRPHFGAHNEASAAVSLFLSGEIVWTLCVGAFHSSSVELFSVERTRWVVRSQSNIFWKYMIFDDLLYNKSTMQGSESKIRESEIPNFFFLGIHGLSSTTWKSVPVCTLTANKISDFSLNNFLHFIETPSNHVFLKTN